jgi:hypothetical protein
MSSTFKPMANILLFRSPPSLGHLVLHPFAIAPLAVPCVSPPHRFSRSRFCSPLPSYPRFYTILSQTFPLPNRRLGYNDSSPSSSPENSEPEDEADEDSNDEDYYRNDYPEDEDADEDMRGYHDAFDDSEGSEAGDADNGEDRGTWGYR